MKEPNFIIAGGIASGTSFLSYSLKDHPQIYLPKIMRPECGFFYKSWEYKKGKDYYLEKWFSDVGDEIAVGERSSLYLHGIFNKINKGIAEKIQQMYPNMKFVFCLRNPIERAYGNYRFTALCGFESLSFKEAILKEEKRINSEIGLTAEIQPHIYKLRGCYYDQLMPFFERFPERNILCIKSEVLAKDTESMLKQVFKFLGVDENFEPSPQKNHTSPNVRNLYIQGVFRKFLGTKLDKMTEEYRQEDAKSLLSSLVGLNLTPSKMPMGADERKMLNDFYVPHNEKLAKLLNWDLSDWL